MAAHVLRTFQSDPSTLTTRPQTVAVALGMERVGVHDNFFALGGHSLLAIQAITKLRKKFQVDVPMRVILQGTPTVAGIAKAIEENMSSISEEDAAVVEKLLDQIEGKFS